MRSGLLGLAALLLAGGLNALQTASITAALPFCVVLILMCFSLTTALVRHESSGGKETKID